jgi:ankyrin repeat protein
MLTLVAPLYSQLGLEEQLLEAVGQNNIPLVRQLLAKGADVNYSPKGRPNVLDEAADQRDPELMRALLERNPKRALLNNALVTVVLAGGGPAIKEMVGEPSLDEVSEPLEFDVASATSAELLLRAGADPNYRGDISGTTVLGFAASQGAPECAKILLQYGADLNATNKDGDTPLALAACECGAATPPSTSPVMNLLLQRGAHVDHQNHEGETALMIAAERGNLIGVKLLLNHGANPDLRTRTGATALSMARKAGNKEIAEALQAYKR